MYMDESNKNKNKVISTILSALYVLLVITIILAAAVIFVYVFQNDELSYYGLFLVIAIPVAFWLGKKKL